MAQVGIMYLLILKLIMRVNSMRIYTIKFIKNGKKYLYRTTNLKLVKKIEKCCQVLMLGSFDYNEL